MKKAILIFLLALTGTCAWAAEADTIHVSNPETWVGGELQRYVGRTVVFDCPIYVCNIPNNTSGGTMTVSTRRIFAPTNQVYPTIPLSSEFNQLTSLNNSGQMRLTGASGYHRMGEKIYNLKVKVNSTSSLDWISGEWSGNTRADMLQMAEDRFPELGDYRLLICTANLEYYLTVPNPDYSSTMGPHSHAEHQAQREKVSKGLAAINADIYGFVEIEMGDSALAELARDLSKNTGRPYTYISDGTSIYGTYTKAGFVYCTETVETIGAILNNGAVANHRSKMQGFVEKATGEKFLLSENHFKAKSGGSSADNDPIQGAFNQKRVAEAQSVIEQYNRNRNQLKEHDIIVMGDLNAYAKEDPITKFTKAGFTDLHRYFHADSSYSYTFSGQAGYLDHAICSPTMLKQVTGMVGFHVNSDEADAFTYDKSNDRTMFRYSDHDPVVIGLKLDSMLSFEPTMSVNTEDLLYNHDVDIVISNALQEEQRSFYRLYTINGWLVTEGEIIDQAYEVARPQQSGVYILRIYANGVVHQKKIIIL